VAAGLRDNEAMEPRDFLGLSPPFDRLDASALRSVERTLEIAYAPRGEAVLRRSDPPNSYLYVIRKGAVRLERNGATVQMLEEGELFGYPSLLSGDSPTVDVVAEEDCLLYRIPKVTFDELIRIPAFGEYFLEQLAGRLRSSLGGEPRLLAGSMSSHVAQLVGSAAHFIPPGTPIVEAARILDREHVTALIVEGDPPGIITDTDLRSRVVAAGRDPSLPVHEIMTRQLISVPARATLFEALVIMLERRIHHLPVTDEGRIIGLISDTDLLRHQLKSPLYLLRLLEKLEEPSDFHGYAREVAAMVDVLFQSNLDVLEIGRVVATLNDAAAKRLLRLAEQRLGAPPTDYAWIVFGSEGRMEQALLTDQDNALVYRDDVPEAAEYFAQLAESVVAGLEKLGIPRCAGGFMATRWRKPIAAWKRQFSDWIATPDSQALIDAANVFDFRPVHGELSLEPLQEAIREAGRHRLFLGRMAKNALEFRPPLGLFRRIREKAHGIDLKKGGIIPIVALARVHALSLGIDARPTVERIEAAAGREGGISGEGAEVLREAFLFLLHLRLADQLRAHRAGQPVGNSIRMHELSPLHRRQLKDTFLAIAEFQEAMAQQYSTGLLA
jgi:CBS domain-containing protein